MDKLLTPAQAADYLAISKLTLAKWRRARQGPPVIRVEPPAGRSTAKGQTAFRYRMSDLEKFIQARTIIPAKLTEQNGSAGSLRNVTDAEWALVMDLAVYRNKSMQHSHATYSRRDLLNVVLRAASTGAWPTDGIPGNSNPVREWRLRAGRNRDWIAAAIRRLEKLPDFPYFIAARVSIVRRPSAKGEPLSSVALFTDTNAPHGGAAYRRLGWGVDRQMAVRRGPKPRL